MFSLTQWGVSQGQSASLQILPVPQQIPSEYWGTSPGLFFIRPRLWNCQIRGETLGRVPGIFWPLMSPPTTSHLTPTQISREPYTASWSPLLSPCSQHIIVYIQQHIQSDQFGERASARQRWQRFWNADSQACQSTMVVFQVLKR